jgi:hypothetical protein
MKGLYIKKVINYKLAFIIACILLLILLFVSISNLDSLSSKTLIKNDEFDNQFPEISMSINYFSENNIDHGSYGDEGYSSGSFDEMAYQSYPTTTIALHKDSYSTKKTILSNPKTLDQAIAENDEDCMDYEKRGECFGDRQIIENYGEYGDLASRYLPADSIWVNRFDVDSDGVDEDIVFVCGIGGNHCPHYVQIIKDNKVIFTTDGGGIGISLSPVDSKNGFYLDWRNDDDWANTGFCCARGYVRTRFVYKDDKFIPVLEQKVYYLRIDDSDTN